MNFSSVWRVGVFLWLGVWCLPSERVLAALSLQSSFSVSESYTSNLFFEDDNKRDDFGTFLGPNFTLLFENPDIVLGATYAGRMSFFINNPDANRYNQNANIILDLPFLTKRYKRLTVTIDETMRFTPQLDAFSLSGAEDASTSGGFNQGFGGSGSGGATGGGTGGTAGSPGGAAGSAGGAGGGFSGGGLSGVGGGTGVFTTRASAFNNNAGVTLGYAWTPRLHSSLGYTNQYLHFFSSGFQDSLRHNGRTSLSYRVTDQTSVTPSYSYSQTTFLGKSTQETRGDKIITHSPMLGVSHAFTPSLTVSLSGGVSFVKQIGAEEEIPGTGPPPVLRKIPEKFRRRVIGSANISKTYAQGRLTLNFSQSVGTGGGLAAQATRTRQLTARVNHALSRRLNAFGSFGWADNQSIDGNAFDSTTYRIQAGLGYSFASWLFGNFNYSHINQISAGSAANDLNVDQFFLGLTAVADPWFIFR